MGAINEASAGSDSCCVQCSHEREVTYEVNHKFRTVVGAYIAEN